MVLIDENKIKIDKRGEFMVEGFRVDIPSKYRGQGLNAIFTASTRKINKFISNSDLSPVQIIYGTSLLCLTIFRFNSSPVGAYDELVISVPVKYKSKMNLPLLPLVFRNYKNFGYLVLDIMQSTPIAIKHGNLLTGYPHNDEVISMDVEKINNNFVFEFYGCHNEKILKVGFNKISREKTIEHSYMTYYIEDGSLSRIRMDIYGIESKAQGLKLTLGNHKISQLVNNLDIGNHPVYSRFYNDVIEVNPVTLDKL